MEIFLWSVALVLGFTLLWKGGDYVIDASSDIANRLELPPIIVGMTLLAFGTSLPELFVNITALFNNNDTIIFGNIIGSNISNTWLILGTAAILTPITIHRDIIYKNLLLNVLAVFVLILCLFPKLAVWNTVAGLSQTNGFILLGLFLLSLNAIKKIMSGAEESVEKSTVTTSPLKLSLSFGLGLLALLGGARLVYDASLFLATAMGFSQAFISLFMIAIGTSLPELITTVIAASRHQSGLLLGNIIGSNIFNIFLILGVCATLKPLEFDPLMKIDLYILLLSALSLLGLSILPKYHTFSRYKGIVLILCYGLYISFIYLRG